jgi:hypothetical protein
LFLDIVRAGVVVRVDCLHESSLDSKVCSSMFGFDRSESLLEVRPEEWKRHSAYDAFGKLIRLDRIVECEMGVCMRDIRYVQSVCEINRPKASFATVL